MSTFYFDASDGGPTDPDTAWQNTANAFDGSLSTVAQANIANMNGSTSTQYLMGEGTNAPSMGLTIYQVKARLYGSVALEAHTYGAAIYTDSLGELLGTATKSDASTGWGNYAILSEPTGGWTWTKLQALEVKIYATDNGTSVPGVWRVEIEVYSDPIPGRIYRIQGFQ